MPASGHGNLFSIGVELTFPVLYFGSPTTPPVTLINGQSARPHRKPATTSDPIITGSPRVVVSVCNRPLGMSSLLLSITCTDTSASQLPYDETRRDEDGDGRQNSLDQTRGGQRAILVSIAATRSSVLYV